MPRPSATQPVPHPKREETRTPHEPLLPRIFAGFLGAFLGLSLLKFGNPPIMEKWVTRPENIYEFLLGYPWPLNWALLLLTVIAITGVSLANFKQAIPRWLLGLPLIWFGWQLVSATNTLDTDLTRETLKHFAACLVCFYLGCFSLSQVTRMGLFWLGLLFGFILVVIIGWQQHFGGLDETRRYFFLYIYPTLKEIPPGYLKKISSNRIFSTLFYPNSLAGALLLFLPISLGVIERFNYFVTKPAKFFLMGLISISALACLYWSGSKGGWLLALGLAMLTLLRSPLGNRLKLGLVGAVLLLGLVGFFWKYAGFFQKGATSVSARFDYWSAALQTAKSHPILGTGPGTFYIPYQSIKRPESEPSRLVHNDYLEQASDSGILGLLTYCAFVITSLVWIFRRIKQQQRGIDSQQWLEFAVAVGVLAWALQSCWEFGLYIPGLAWPAFALFGWLIGNKSSTAPNP